MYHKSVWCMPKVCKTVYEKISEKIPYIPPTKRLVGFENKDL